MGSMCTWGHDSEDGEQIQAKFLPAREFGDSGKSSMVSETQKVGKTTNIDKLKFERFKSTQMSLPYTAWDVTVPSGVAVEADLHRCAHGL